MKGPTTPVRRPAGCWAASRGRAVSISHHGRQIKGRGSRVPYNNVLSGFGSQGLGFNPESSSRAIFHLGSLDCPMGENYPVSAPSLV